MKQNNVFQICVEEQVYHVRMVIKAFASAVCSPLDVQCHTRSETVSMAFKFYGLDMDRWLFVVSCSLQNDRYDAMTDS